MFNKIITAFKGLDKLTKLIINNGLIFCAIICLISIILLVTYNFSFTLPILFSAGLVLFRLSLIFGIEFIICGFVVDGIKKQMI